MCGEGESGCDGEDGDSAHNLATEFWPKVINDDFSRECLDEEAEDGQGEYPPDILEKFLFHGLFWLASHCVHVVDIDVVSISKDGHDDAESDSNFGGGDCHDDDDHGLSGHGGFKSVVGLNVRVGVSGEGQEGKVDGIEHQFDAHEDDDGVFSDEYSDTAEGKHGKAEGEEVSERDVFVDGTSEGEIEECVHGLEFPLGEHDRADDSDEEENGDDFEWPDVGGEERTTDGLG